MSEQKQSEETRRGPQNPVCKAWAAHQRARLDGVPFERWAEPDLRLEGPDLAAYQEMLRQRFPRLDAQEREELMKYAPTPSAAKWDPSEPPKQEIEILLVEHAILSVAHRAGGAYGKVIGKLPGSDQYDAMFAAAATRRTAAHNLRTLALIVWAFKRPAWRAATPQLVAQVCAYGGGERAVEQMLYERLRSIEREVAKCQMGAALA